MRVTFATFIVLATTAAASAQSVALVIPGRPGVPVIINGVDASYAVVEGDSGLARGVHVQPTVYGGRAVAPLHVGRYFPSAGENPGYGRLEIEPPADRRLPQPAEGYHQSWSAQSSATPAQPDVPLYPPPVIGAPDRDFGGQQNVPDRKVRKYRN